MAMSYCSVHQRTFALYGVCPECMDGALPHIDANGAKTWKQTMDLKMVGHPSPWLTNGPLTWRLMQKWFCKETGEVRWEAVPFEQGLAMEFPS